MPERWEDELTKLDQLEPSDDVKTRVGHVPVHEDGSRPVHRVLVIVTAFAIFLAAGAFAFRALGPVADRVPPSAAAPTDTDVAIATLETSPSGSTATLNYGGSEREGIPIEILTPGPTFDHVPPGGFIWSFLGWPSASTDTAPLTSLDPEPISIPADVRIEAGADDLILLAFAEGSDGRLNVMTPIPVPTDLHSLDAGTRYLFVAVGRGDETAAPQFAFAVDLTPPSIDTTGQTPDVVSVTCGPDGTEATPEAVVTDEGIRFKVEDRSNVDEVVINGVSGEASYHGADIDLSSSTKHTFQIPPGDYQVGCFDDAQLTGSDGGDDWDSLPGMVPVRVTDPNGIYVSPELDCPGSEQISSEGREITSVDNPTPEGTIRSATEGIEGDDVIEPTGYPAFTRLAAFQGGGPHQYRIVRAGRVIGSLWLSSFGTDQGFFTSLDLQACADPGLTVRDGSQGGSTSPTPAGIGVGVGDGNGVPIQVFNGTKVAGLASAVQQELEDSGYMAVADPGNALTSPIATSVIYFRGGDGAGENERLATEVARQLEVNADVRPLTPDYEVAASEDAILIIVLGDDYADTRS